MMNWFIFISGLIIVTFIYMFLQAVLYKTRYHKLATNTGLRFLHLTDIHIGLNFISVARIRKTIERAQPNYILISGDSLDKPKDLAKLVRWFRKINFQVPVFSILGNHEHRCFYKNPAFKRDFIVAMNKLNIRVLVNEVLFLDGKKEQNNPAKRVALAGLDDYKTGIIVKKQIFDNLRDKNDCVLAFSHNPDIALHIPERSVDLLIAGHFHGGQMWLPFKLEYLLLRKDVVSKMGYIKDFAIIRNNRVYISRGLGTVLVPFRFFSIPEVTVFDT